MPGAASACPSGRRARRSRCPSARASSRRLCANRCSRPPTSASPVLFIGELGSGREAYARYLHSLSARSSKPFFMVVAASSGADPAAALFGSERDGKVAHGALDQAAGGSLYLNGLEDLHSEAQRALDRAPSSRTATPASADASGCRSTCAGSARRRKDFEGRASPEPFRRDLIAHLNVITLRVPPLRDYAEDVPDLLRYYVDRLVDDQHLPLRRFSVAAQNRLRNYPWPGNLGELQEPRAARSGARRRRGDPARGNRARARGEDWRSTSPW